MTIEIDPYSRLNFAQLMTGSDGTREVEWWDLPVIRKISPADSDTTLRVENHVRIDRLANDYLNSSILWDVIAEINGFRLLPMALRFGDMIRIPSQIRTMVSIRAKEDQ